MCVEMFLEENSLTLKIHCTDLFFDFYPTDCYDETKV